MIECTHISKPSDRLRYITSRNAIGRRNKNILYESAKDGILFNRSAYAETYLSLFL